MRSPSAILNAERLRQLTIEHVVVIWDAASHYLMFVELVSLFLMFVVILFPMIVALVSLFLLFVELVLITSFWFWNTMDVLGTVSICRVCMSWLLTVTMSVRLVFLVLIAL